MSDHIPMICGIDPGTSGGICFMPTTKPIAHENITFAYKMPDTETDVADLLREYKPFVVIAYIEAVHAMPPHMPGNTSVASFAFGKNYGFLRGVLVGLQIPFVEVSPQRWKKALGLTFSKEHTTTEKKNGSKQLAQQWWPNLKITHAIAECLLIGEYGRRLR